MEVLMPCPARVRFFVFLSSLVLLTAATATAAVPGFELQNASADGLSLRVDVPAGAEVWTGLVALPRGRDVVTVGLPAGVSVGEAAIMHGVRVAPLTVSGDAGRDVSLDLDLSFAATAAPVPERTVLATTFARLVESQVINGAAMRNQYDEVPGTYLMICAEPVGVAEAVEPLARWRRQQGYNVIVVNTVVTGGTTTAIKNYIQGVYDTAEAPLAYVTLVGDAGGALNVATWHETVSGYYGEGDHEYTRLDGNDILSDAHIGRLSARSVSELEGIVAKILDYEQTPDTFMDPGWFQRAVLAGDPAQSGATTIYVNQWLKQQLLDLNYTQIDTIWSGNFATQIFAGLNQGASVYAYRGYLGCSGFSQGYIDNLSNGSELPFAVMPTCASGSFDDTHSYTEAMLRNPDGGAIGAVGTATTGTHTRYNNCYFHGVWEGALNEPDRHLGYAHTRGKLELFRQYQQTEANIVAIWSTWNNLMGDPATEMRQAVAVSPVVSYPATVPATAGVVPVTVNHVGARVCAWRDGEVQTVGWTDTNGEVMLPLPAGTTAGALQITVTGDDLKPHMGTLQVGSAGAYCSAVAWTWNDGADGMPDPGETGELSLELRNIGGFSAPNVTVGLESRTENVTVDGGPVAVGSMSAGQSVPVGSWMVTLPADLPDGLPVSLAVRAQSGDDVWSSEVLMTMAAPAFEVASMQWTGLPGQTATLTVTLDNIGSAEAQGAVVEFASTSTVILPAGPTVTSLGDVPATGTAMASFDLAVSEAAWGGHLANCRLTITTGGGTLQNLDLPLTTGSASLDSPVGPGTMGYLAWDNQDPVADAPAYWWRELAPNYGGVGADVGLTDFAYEQDDTRTVDLPFEFRFHGQDYDKISICSNGWAALGQSYLVHYRNWGLPAVGAPDALLAVFWDDLSQSGSNRVYHHYFAAEGIYVIQWSRMLNRHNGIQNCEVLLYDPAVHPTATGDGLIVYQYQQVTNNDNSRGYATVGIQDDTVGLTYTYYNRYANGARTLSTGRAIAFVPTSPEVPSVASVTPDAVTAVLMPGETRQRTLRIENNGAEGSVLAWQAALSDVRAAVEPAGQRERTVDVVSPNGGEDWAIGQNRVISWSADGGVSQVNLQVDRGTGWESLVSGVDASLGSWTWTVTAPSSNTCRVRVADHHDILVTDVSDAYFAISADLSWVTLDAMSGEVPAGEVEEVVVTLDAGGLEPGEYTAELLIMTSGGAPVVIPVNLVVDTSTAAPELPSNVSLGAAFPNPFNPRTVISFALPEAGHVLLTVHDLRGRMVRTLQSGTAAAGHHEVTFDGVDDAGRSLASGMYVYRLVTSELTQSRPMTLVK